MVRLQSQGMGQAWPGKVCCLYVGGVELPSDISVYCGWPYGANSTNGKELSANSRLARLESGSGKTMKTLTVCIIWKMRGLKDLA
jgi:hypothetical protein